MRITLNHIIGALIGGAVSGLFFYVLGHHDGKRNAEFKATQAIAQALQKRAGINETVNNMDSVALCLELGGVRGQCEQLRGLAANQH
ncbi:hypothetical protein P8H26_14865 [Pseudochrobactrum sp. sp1633]|uniref:hypothetical protein n=1 Tax=Pseudochrobactrum sp. sp1633 TaxID=3036706 RepID=UPI0025A57889|nr:hypothetical protein [Pseudochrobactrum sp. sp1633]MDM8346672.1 hypothetical protein [Pseudochrobactrum sp. sp1633]